MATKDYFVEYNFATNEGHFETPEEYEKRIMVDVPPAHKFLKKIVNAKIPNSSILKSLVKIGIVINGNNSLEINKPEYHDIFLI